jgi:SSS family solute:Na+ symporter
MGGQVSVMITECVQGMFCCFAFLAVSFTILIKVHWSHMVQALQLASAPNASLINPFNTGAVNDFNVTYYLIGLFGAFYGYLSWQGGQGFYSSARNPHEQKMGQVIGVWRDIPKTLMLSLMGLAALAITKLPEFANTANSVATAVGKIGDPNIQNEMRVPIAMAHFLPVVIKGLLATIFLFFSFTCHDTYMHSWGSIFVQDVYMPIKNRVLSPDQHIRLLRRSITAVAIFAFVFSLLVPPGDKILMFFAATGTIWLGGSGAVIIGGLYWKRGTSAAAYTALSVGLLGGVVTMINMYAPGFFVALLGHKIPYNPQQIYLGAMVAAAILYPTVALITSRGKEGFNLDRLLHRGKYLRESDHIHARDKGKQSKWALICGITQEFSKADRILAGALLAWQIIWFGWFAAYMIARLFVPVTDQAFILYPPVPAMR